MKLVQIDLARQKETLDEVFKFFDLAKAYGYDGVFLYLEDRIRTKTYPYISVEESYSEDEVRQMVAYADKLGLELIPVVSNFAHTERFLEHPELAHIAELRGGINGFHSAGVYVTSCPLLKEAQEFFDAYISEVAALFPSKYFNIGLDEDLDIGSCELCKAEVEKYNGFGRLFLNHIIRCNNFLKSIGKEMMMFDDMVWYYPELVPEIPKDVIMISWAYWYVDRYPRMPFANDEKIDRFREYNKLGIRCIMMVWSYFINNVDSYTICADNYDLFGYANSTWQMSHESMHYIHPHVAYTGKLWNGIHTDDPQARMMEVVGELCGTDDPAERAILAEAATKPFLTRTPAFHLHNPIIRTNDNYDDEYKDVRYQYELLKTVRVKNDYTEQLLYRAEREKIFYETFRLAQDVFDYRTGLKKISIPQIVEKLGKLKAVHERQYEEQYAFWQRVRPGIPSAALDEDRAKVLGDMDKVIETAKNAVFGEKGVLDVTVVLPDKTILVKHNFTVTFDDGSEQVLPLSYLKPLGTADYNILDKGPYVFTASYLLDGHKAIEKCTINISGFGGAYIAYVQAYSDGKYYVPEKVIVKGGKVENEDHLLVNDSRFASFGYMCMADAMKKRSLAKIESIADVCFREYV